MSAPDPVMQIPFMRLDREFMAVQKNIMPPLISALESGRVLQGPQIAQLENRLAAMHRLKHGVAVNSGTDALIFAIAALDLPEGSRVAVPAMTFVASASAIVHNRCRPVFVDVDPLTMLADKEALLRLVRDREIEAIVAVHLYGQMLDLAEIAREARQRGIVLIEDAAQALGSSSFDNPPGAHGDITCLSFDPTKVIGAYGSGGALMTNNDDFAETARLLRYHGHVGKRLYKYPGFNSQMDTIQAVIIDEKLNYLDRWQARRSEIAALFAEGLAETPVRLLELLPGNVHNFHKYVIVPEDRDGLQSYLATRGIQTQVHYTVPLHLQPCFANEAPAPSLPQVEQASQTILSLPIYAQLTDAEADYIVAAIAQFYQVKP